jgi:hypothetical protein
VLIFVEFQYLFSPAHFGEKVFLIEDVLNRRRHENRSFLTMFDSMSQRAGVQPFLVLEQVTKQGDLSMMVPLRSGRE